MSTELSVQAAGFRLWRSAVSRLSISGELFVRQALSGVTPEVSEWDTNAYALLLEARMLMKEAQG